MCTCNNNVAVIGGTAQTSYVIFCISYILMHLFPLSKNRSSLNLPGAIAHIEDDNYLELLTALTF
jgi:hypothetical protein